MSKFAKKVDLAYLKYNADNLDIDKLQNVPTNLSNLATEVDKLDFDKLVPVPVDLSKLGNVAKTDFVKKDVYNAKIKNIEDKIPDIANVTTKTNVNAKINEVKGKIARITNLATTAAILPLQKLTITQKLMKMNKQLLIMIMINILLLQNLIS